MHTECLGEGPGPEEAPVASGAPVGPPPGRRRGRRKGRGPGAAPTAARGLPCGCQSLGRFLGMVACWSCGATAEVDAWMPTGQPVGAHVVIGAVCPCGGVCEGLARVVHLRAA